MATYKHIAKLIVKHRKNTLTVHEKEELETWRNLSTDNQLLFDRLNDTEYVSEKLDELYSVDVNEEWGRIRQLFPYKKNRRQRALKYVALVAALFIGGMIFFWITGKHRGAGANLAQKVNNAPAPDEHRIALKLADNRIVYLDSSVNGHIALQYRSAIYKRGDLLQYEWSTGDAQPKPEYNTLTTPRARTFTIELSDGSKAWLNAASSITYPTAFTGNERVVQVSGEVYFEVNPAPVSLNSDGHRQPFIVYVNSPRGKSKHVRVEVMGTHFNVNAYDEEPAVKTTLLEGKVKVANVDVDQTAVLSPGQQAQVNDKGQLDVVKYADILEVMAWHKNLFVFNDTDLRLIMQQIARQYDCTVEFKQPVTGHYSLSIARQTKVSDVLEQLELAGGVHFELEGKKIIVSP